MVKAIGVGRVQKKEWRTLGFLREGKGRTGQEVRISAGVGGVRKRFSFFLP